MRRHACVGLLAVAAAVLLACDDQGPRTPADIVITPNLPHVPMGETLQLTATVVDADGRAIPDEPVSFQSSDPSILTVSESGLLTSVGARGTSTIRAVSGDLSAEVEAEVVLGPSNLFVSPASLDLESDEAVLLNVTVTDEHGDSIPDAEVAFQTSDFVVADVSFDGFVTGRDPGTATITVTSGTYLREVPVTVTQVPRDLRLTPFSLVLAPGASRQLTARVVDLGGDAIPEAVIAFSSSDEAILTVDETGLIQSVGGDGLVIVTATSGSLSATSTIYVGTPPPGEVLASVTQTEAWRVVLASGGRYLLAAHGSELLSGTLPDFGFPVSIPFDGAAADIAVNPAGTMAYVPGANVAGGGLGVGVVDLTTDQVIDIIPIPSSNLFSVALSPDESRLIVGTLDGIEVVDLASGASIASQAIRQVDRLVNDPARPLVYAVTAFGEVFEIAVEGEVSARQLAIPEAVNDLAVAPDGAWLYALGDSGDVIHVWNLVTGSEERTLTTARGISLAITPNGKFLYLMDFGRITILEPVAGLVLRSVELGNWPRQIAFSGDLAIVVDNSGNADPDAVHFVR